MSKKPPTEIATSLPPPRKRRSPDEQHRERLTARIAKLKTEGEDVARGVVAKIHETAARELEEKITKARDRVRSRYIVRIEPLERMLAALGEA